MIEKVTDNNFAEVLPLIREYQEFYGVEDINDEKNREYFSQFLAGSENGVLHVFRYEGQVVGFTTIYKGFSSTRAETVAVLNDLYVQPTHRGLGFGKALIDHAIHEAKSLGYQRLQWLTADENKNAQKLYDTFEVSPSTWLFYALQT